MVLTVYGGKYFSIHRVWEIWKNNIFIRIVSNEIFEFNE